MKPRKQNKIVQRSFFLVMLYLCVLMITVDSALLSTKAPLAKRTLCYQGISLTHSLVFLSCNNFLRYLLVLFVSFSFLLLSTLVAILYLITKFVTGSDAYQSQVKSCALLDTSYTGVWMCSKIQVFCHSLGCCGVCISLLLYPYVNSH